MTVALPVSLGDDVEARLKSAPPLVSYVPRNVLRTPQVHGEPELTAGSQDGATLRQVGFWKLLLEELQSFAGE